MSRREHRELPAQSDTHVGPRPRPVSNPWSALLHLQGTAGNRAVTSLVQRQRANGAPALTGRARTVQRFVHEESTGKLLMTNTYADTQFRWNSSDNVRTEDPNDPLTTYRDFFTDHRVLGEKNLSDATGQPVYEITVVTDSDKQMGALISPWLDTAGFANPKAPTTAEVGTVKPVAAKIRATLSQSNRTLLHKDGAKYGPATALPTRWSLVPHEILPEKPDLPASGVDLRSVRPEGESYYESACVLIALVKANHGVGRAQTITGRNDLTEKNAVQALHDYYMSQREPVQYDDHSTRQTVMNEWGYRLVYSGETPLKELSTHVTLSKGKGKDYIFDIPGHTVKVRLLKGFPDLGAVIDNTYETFAFDSDKTNFNKDEHRLPVRAVYEQA